MEQEPTEHERQYAERRKLAMESLRRDVDNIDLMLIFDNRKDDTRLRGLSKETGDKLREAMKKLSDFDKLVVMGSLLNGNLEEEAKWWIERAGMEKPEQEPWNLWDADVEGLCHVFPDMMKKIAPLLKKCMSSDKVPAEMKDAALESMVETGPYRGMWMPLSDLVMLNAPIFTTKEFLDSYPLCPANLAWVKDTVCMLDDMSPETTTSFLAAFIAALHRADPYQRAEAIRSLMACKSPEEKCTLVGEYLQRADADMMDERQQIEHIFRAMMQNLNLLPDPLLRQFVGHLSNLEDEGLVETLEALVSIQSEQEKIVFVKNVLDA